MNILILVALIPAAANNSDECSADVKSACSVTTAQNLGWSIQRRALVQDVAIVLDDINSASSDYGTAVGGFYASVFDFNNICVADAVNPGLIGKSLNEIVSSKKVVPALNLGEQFQTAAMSGGSWVSFPETNGQWKRSWVLGFPATGYKLPLAGPGGLIGSSVAVPSDEDLKTTWSSAFPPPWADLDGTVELAKAYYVAVGYMETVSGGTKCDADADSGVFESCQHENAFNLALYAKHQLKAAIDAGNAAGFNDVVTQLSAESSPYKMDKGFYISMFEASTRKCVADGGTPGNVNKLLEAILSTGGQSYTADEGKALNAQFIQAANKPHGRWVTHPWASLGSTIKKDKRDSDKYKDVLHMVNRYSLVQKIPAMPGSDYADAEGYYILSGFSDPEHHMLGSSFLPYNYCKANSRTGCSVTTAQNLAFDTYDELDANQAEPEKVWWRVNNDTIWPKTYEFTHHWQGYLQKPVGFYVFAYTAADALLCAQGAIPVAMNPRPRSIYDIQRGLGVVSHPRLREVFLGISFTAKGGWLTYQWSNRDATGSPAPRKRTYMLPWRKPDDTGPYVYYFGVGYDDVHPEDVAKPCLASEFATCSEEHTYNLAHIVQTDILRMGVETVMVGLKESAKEMTSIGMLFDEVTSNAFYKLSSGFYAFVFDFEGPCMAHGAHPGSVGKSLLEMIALRNIEGAPLDLHEQFKQAADSGGKWVKYPWKDTPSETVDLKNKYSFVLPAEHRGVKYYVGVGFQSGSALAWSPASTTPKVVKETVIITGAPAEEKTDFPIVLIIVIVAAVLLVCLMMGVACYFKSSRDDLARRYGNMQSSNPGGMTIGSPA